MSENAAYVCYGRELLHTIPMPRALCAELVAYLGTRTDCVSRACTTTGRYYFVPTAAAQANLDAVGVEFGNCRIVKDFSEVKGDVTQISAISAGDMNIPPRKSCPSGRTASVQPSRASTGWILPRRARTRGCICCARISASRRKIHTPSVTATTMPHAPCGGAPLSDEHCACRFKGRVCHADQ